jgi:hypothetical protein
MFRVKNHRSTLTYNLDEHHSLIVNGVQTITLLSPSRSGLAFLHRQTRLDGREPALA